MNVVFDSMGTLFELTPLHERLGEAVTEAWFERTLHSAATLTMLGEFVPFAELAAATLETTCAKLGVDVDRDDVLAQLQQLPPAPDAGAALAQCEHAYVLTNGGREAGEQLLEQAGLADRVERVFGVDEVRAYKPDPRPYRLVLDAVGDATLVATHAWDCRGAVAAGLDAVWVDRSERAWPFPGEPVRSASGLVEALG
jgi:2-haloacid dehalogenase